MKQSFRPYAYIPPLTRLFWDLSRRRPGSLRLKLPHSLNLIRSRATISLLLQVQCVSLSLLWLSLALHVSFTPGRAFRMLRAELGLKWPRSQAGLPLKETTATNVLLLSRHQRRPSKWWLSRRRHLRHCPRGSLQPCHARPRCGPSRKPSRLRR